MGNFIQGHYKSTDEQNKFKGDALEILAEIFFWLHPTDERIGLSDYQHIPITEDYGVDGKGINPNGVRSAVQVKFRSNMKDRIDYADLARTYTSAVKRKWIEPYQKYNVYLFTNAIGPTIPAKDELNDSLVLK